MDRLIDRERRASRADKLAGDKDGGRAGKRKRRSGGERERWQRGDQGGGSAKAGMGHRGRQEYETRRRRLLPQAQGPPKPTASRKAPAGRWRETNATTDNRSASKCPIAAPLKLSAPSPATTDTSSLRDTCDTGRRATQMVREPKGHTSAAHRLSQAGTPGERREARA